MSNDVPPPPSAPSHPGSSVSKEAIEKFREQQQRLQQHHNRRLAADFPSSLNSRDLLASSSVHESRFSGGLSAQREDAASSAKSAQPQLAVSSSLQNAFPSATAPLWAPTHPAVHTPGADSQIGAASVLPPQINQPSVGPPQMNQPPMNLPQMNQSQLYHFQMNQPPMNQHPMNQPLMNLPQMNQPSINQSQINQPPMSLPQVNQSQVNQPPMNSPQVNQPPMNSPQVNQSQVNQSQVNQSQVNQFQMNQPATNQPPVNQLQMSQPPMNLPQMNHPSINQSQINQPPINQSQINQPPVSPPEVNQSQVTPANAAPMNSAQMTEMNTTQMAQMSQAQMMQMAYAQHFWTVQQQAFVNFASRFGGRGRVGGVGVGRGSFYQMPFSSPGSALSTTQKEGLAANFGKPESFEALGGTDWLRIRTSTGKKYFYNKKTKTSTWKAPEELQELLARLDAQQSMDFYDPDEEASDDGETLEQETAQDASKRDSAERPSSDGQCEKGAKGQDGEGETSGVPKNAEKAQGAASEQSCTSGESDASDESTDEEVETETRKEIAALTDFVRRVEAFKQMLREENLGPFAVYEKSMPRLVFQPRFLAIAPEQRKKLFEKCLKEITNENRMSLKEHIDALKRLLEESQSRGQIHTNSTVESLDKKLNSDPRWRGGASISNEEWTSIRRRLVDEFVEQQRARRERERQEARLAFKKLVKEHLKGRPSEEWNLLRRELRSHAVYTAVVRDYVLTASARERQTLFQEVCDDLEALAASRKRQASELEETSAKRERMKKAEAATAFTNMLVEKVKNPLVEGLVNRKTIEEAEVLSLSLKYDSAHQLLLGVAFTTLRDQLPERLLAGDARNNAADLTQQEKQDLYKAFVKDFCASRVALFASRLNSLGDDDLSLSFSEIEELAAAFALFLRQAPSVTRFASRLSKAGELKKNFDEETLQPLLDELKTDIRFKRLDGFPGRRLNLVKARLE